MRPLIVGAVLGAVLALGGGLAAGDVLYEQIVHTQDSLVRGTTELEDRVVTTAKGERWRQEITGARSVVNRRGVRYSKPGHRVTLDQLDRDLRYEINLDAGTYAPESLTGLARDQEAAIVAAERALKVDPAGPAPVVDVSVTRTGERQTVHGRECERVILRAAKEVVPATTRGMGGATTTPVRFSDTFDVCLMADTAETRELRSLETRIASLTGERGPLAGRQLRVFEARRDLLAVFELLNRVLEREVEKLGGLAVRWDRVFRGPRRGESDVTLYRYEGEVARLEGGTLDPAGFELPPGLTLDSRRGPAAGLPAP